LLCTFRIFEVWIRLFVTFNHASFTLFFFMWLYWVFPLIIERNSDRLYF
jgi:uncharacterized integral membrane protein